MWCLETIIALNEKAAELVLAGRPQIEAYAEVGILMPTTTGSLDRVERSYLYNRYEDIQTVCGVGQCTSDEDVGELQRCVEGTPA
jgi:hypothetical protein